MEDVKEAGKTETAAEPVIAELIGKKETPVQEVPVKEPEHEQLRLPIDEAEQDVQEAEAAAVPEMPAQPQPGRRLMLYLNGKPLILPPKQDGTPYYLMDMLEYSGLDLEQLKAPVILEVNGESGAFQQELRAGDSVRIFEQEQR